jgi:hypothetical protein
MIFIDENAWNIKIFLEYSKSSRRFWAINLVYDMEKFK